MAATSFAQFTTGGGSSSSSHSYSGSTEDYNIVGISYDNTRITYDYRGSNDPDPVSTNGVALRYLHGFSVSNKLPMYVETGLNLNFNFASVPVDDNDLEDYLSNQYQFAALAVPVNFAYKFDINDTFDIKPYLGLNLKLNLIGKNRLKITDDDLRDLMEDEGYDLDDYEEWGSVFNKDDMGGKNATWNRFQLGWHIGADFVFNKFFAGLSYGTDFIPAFSYKKNKINTATFNVGVGLYF